MPLPNPLKRTHQPRPDSTEIVASAELNLGEQGAADRVRAVTAASKKDAEAAWKWYEQLGEVHYAISRSARVAGYAKLMPVKLGPAGQIEETIEGGMEADIVSMLESPYGGLRGLIERFVVMSKVPGDAYLLRCRDSSGQVEGYDFMSSTEMDLGDLETRGRNGRLEPGQKFARTVAPSVVRSGLGSGSAITTEHEVRDLIGRVWRPSARYVEMPDSPMNALDMSCELLDLLTKTLRGKLLSRLALNGILFVPSAINELQSVGTAAGVNGSTSNKMIDRLLAAATYNILNHAHAESAAPVMVSGPGEAGQYMKFITVDREIFEVDMKLRNELIDRILYGLDVTPSTVKGMGDQNHWCNDEQTEVLTRLGWRNVDTIAVGDEVLALDHVTGSSTWRTVTDLYVATVANEPMRALSSRTHSSLTTLNHRWPTFTRDGVRRWATTAELNSNDFITTGAPCADVPAIAKHSDALVELAAWFWTEGNIGSCVTIAQSHTANPHKVARLRSALIAEFGPHGFAEAIQQNTHSYGGPITVFRLRKWAGEVLTSVAPGKAVTDEFIDSLTVAQLHLFIDVSCMGDGHHWKAGERDIWQRDPKALDAYERACILAGYSVSRQPSHDGGTTVRALRTSSVRPVKAAQQAAATGANGAMDSIVPYTGRVWCPTVAELGSYLARRNGRVFYTGNSAWAVEDDERRVNVQPDIETLMWALTRMVLRAEMVERNAKPGRILRRGLWYDLTRANVSTNLAEDARQGHDRVIIGDAGARRLTGIPEADAPTEAEQIRSFGRKHGDPYLATFGLDAADDIDWDKVGKGGAQPGPAEDSPGDAPESSPSNRPGRRGSSESDTPKRLRPA